MRSWTTISLALRLSQRSLLLCRERRGQCRFCLAEASDPLVSAYERNKGSSKFNYANKKPFL